MALTTGEALIATGVSALVILATRAFPFVLFAKKKPPSALAFVEKSIPPMIMAILVVHCFRDAVDWHSVMTQATALFAVVVLHLWRHNPMISIFGGTALYMVLIRLWN